MEESSKTGVFVAVICWLVILAAIAFAARNWLIPMFKQKARQQVTQQTSSEGKYKHEVRLAADAFSGYCILRSPEVAARLKAQGVKLTIVDDKADYPDRIRKLQSGELQMAVFTIDSLVKSGADLGDFPASIVYIIDETKGADAMVAYSNAVASLANLNHKDARIVYTPDSPSEFLSRVVIASFSLPQLPQKWSIPAVGAEDVLKQLKNVSPQEKRAYVLWEPYLTRARQLPGVHVLVDSSRLKGFIVDVLVCQREFLVNDYYAAKAIVEAYARAAYVYNSDLEKLEEIVVEDARATGGERMDKSAAEQLVRGIQWKNTVENYGHFGLAGPQPASGLEHVEDMIGKISDVLVKTGAIKKDPLQGKANTIFWDKILRDMKAENFHPVIGSNFLPESSAEPDAEQVRGEQPLAKLSEGQWAALIPVGEFRAEPISFARGTASVNMSGKRELAQLAKSLQSWPRYYILVVGQARPEGDIEANKLLAQSRADAAVSMLMENNISGNRIKTRAMVAAQGGGDAQSVLFVVCQQPY